MRAIDVEVLKILDIPLLTREVASEIDQPVRRTSQALDRLFRAGKAFVVFGNKRTGYGWYREPTAPPQAMRELRQRSWRLQHPELYAKFSAQAKARWEALSPEQKEQRRTARSQARKRWWDAHPEEKERLRERARQSWNELPSEERQRRWLLHHEREPNCDRHPECRMANAQGLVFEVATEALEPLPTDYLTQGAS